MFRLLYFRWGVATHESSKPDISGKDSSCSWFSLCWSRYYLHTFISNMRISTYIRWIALLLYKNQLHGQHDEWKHKCMHNRIRNLRRRNQDFTSAICRHVRARQSATHAMRTARVYCYFLGSSRIPACHTAWSSGCRSIGGRNCPFHLPNQKHQRQFAVCLHLDRGT